VAAQTSNHRLALTVILSASAAIVLLLFWLIYFQEPLKETGGKDSLLPWFNTLCNALCTVCIVAGIWNIRRGRKRLHGMFMIGATVASACFFVGYLIYHSLYGDTRFTGSGWIRPVYYFILITHIVLSIAVVPMVLTTLYAAARRQWQMHRKVARWTYPVWLYVSVTGIIVFAMLRLF
jgi:putative membrane protein